MRAFLLAAAVASGTALAATTEPPAPAAADVAGNTAVDFKNPEKFVDAWTDGYGTGASDDVTRALRVHLEKLGRQYLPAGQQLQITITDIDLAGRYDMMRSRTDWIRVMRDVDWPRIDLHYRLTQDGRTLREADARVSDMNYLSRIALQRSTEPLRYEKDMLAQWFAKTFGAS
ncbi:MAG: DUF3016 domain-containing protein [Solimonas sp.]